MKIINSDILKNIVNKSKQNSEKCSSNPQKGKRKATKEQEIEETNRKQIIRWQT